MVSVRSSDVVSEDTEAMRYFFPLSRDTCRTFDIRSSRPVCFVLRIFTHMISPWGKVMRAYDVAT